MIIISKENRDEVYGIDEDIQDIHCNDEEGDINVERYLRTGKV